jgi:hypothetical protein
MTLSRKFSDNRISFRYATLCQNFCFSFLPENFVFFYFLVPEISADEVKRRTTEEGFVGDGGNNLLPQKCFLT